MKKQVITYKATNTRTGKFYIGSTKNFKKRQKSHLTNKENLPFQNALRKNPEEWEWEIFEDDYEEPILEQALLDMWFGVEQCLNLNPSATHPPKVTGKKMWVNETGEQTFSYDSPGEGWVQGVSENRKIQNSLAKKGKKESSETRARKSRAHKGKKRIFSDEHCANIAKSKKNNQPGAKSGGLVAGKLPWWVNKEGQNRRSHDKPEGEWKRGRVWKED